MIKEKILGLFDNFDKFVDFLTNAIIWGNLTMGQRPGKSQISQKKNIYQILKKKLKNDQYYEKNFLNKKFQH